MEKTLVLLKPDAVQRSLVGKILNRFEEKGLKLVGAKMIVLTSELLDEHYAHHKEKPFFSSLKKFMISAPVFACVLEGENAVNIVRLLVGETNGAKAAPGTVRGDYSMGMQNLIHASDSIETAEKEVKRFFKKEELIEWTRRSDSDVYGE
ncbi:nucleoside-diphosphate kinase [Candidatus Micrarchaeota archaeon]|nr:nucleoside-diphosphate kinase [Candidatus Micrarchaeota archaeon]